MTHAFAKPMAAEPFEDDLAYLEDELSWIEARAQRIIAQRDATVTSDDEGDDELARPRLQAAERHEQTLRERIDARYAANRRRGPTLGMDRVSELHGLDAFERTVLLLATAPVFSKRFEKLFGELAGERLGADILTIEVVFEFCQLSLRERIERRVAFAGDSRLIGGELVTLDMMARVCSPEDLLDATPSLTARTLDLLVGREGLSEQFQEFSSVEPPRATLDDVVLPPEDKRRILQVVDHHDAYLDARRRWGFDDVIRYGRGVLMLFHGEPGTGKTMTAHGVAHRLGKRVLNVDIPTFLQNREADRFLPALFREAHLQEAVLFFDECEALFAKRREGNLLMTLLLTELERFEGVAILATNRPEALDEALDRRVLVKIRFPRPDLAARRDIWRRHLPEQAPLSDEVDVDALAACYEMSGGYIKNAVLTAVAAAVHAGGRDPRITMAHLERAARDQLVRPEQEDPGLTTPVARLEDVVLPEALGSQVRELISAARHRRTVLERWGIGRHLSRGKGLAALFHGPPGTGKTLCAEAIACELNLPIRAVSVPTIQSKWVGETQKNLAALFREARAQRAVLFFDEADALVRARGEGHASRHDDAAVNVLLTELERHEGLVLLATNRPEVLDDALSRRLSYRLLFPLPDAKARTLIWRGLLPATVPTEGPLDLESLGTRFALAGGLVRNAVFKAAFRAASERRALRHDDLERAAAEEVAAADEERRPIGFARPVEA